MELVRGQKRKLQDLTRARTVRVGMGLESGGQGYDFCCIGVDEHDRLSDDRYFVFFNQTRSPEGAIAALGASGPDAQVFEIDLDRLPAKIHRLIFTLTQDGDRPMSTLPRGALRILDGGAERAIFRFSGADFTTERAVMVGELYLKGEWRVAAVGQGFAGGLRAVLESFGGVVADDPPPASPPPGGQARGPAAGPRGEPPRLSRGARGTARESRMRSIEARSRGTAQARYMSAPFERGGHATLPRATATASKVREPSEQPAGGAPRGGQMSDVIDYTIFGDDLQMVEIELDPGETVRAEAGAMMYMSEGIEMQTNMGGSGLLGALGRMVTGESFFITNFTHNGRGKGHVAFGAPYPGKIIPLELAALGGTFLCQKDAFLAAAKGVDIEVAFTKRIGAGLFGGEGFILQRLKGAGRAFIHAGGAIVERELERGEVLRVDTGCVVGFAPSVDYDIQFAGGFTNALFGGEGLFFAKLTGPGLVYLQSLPLSRLADRITSGAMRGRDESRGVGGMLGGILGGR